MAQTFDLLGDPIPEGRGLPGRTGHVATAENASKIRSLLVAGLSIPRISAEIGLSAPTLRKHYFRSGKVNYETARAQAAADGRAKVVLLLERAAEAGSVSAMKEMLRVIEAAEIALADKEASDPRPAKLGKKAQTKAMAMDAEAELEDLMAAEGRVN